MKKKTDTYEDKVALLRSNIQKIKDEIKKAFAPALLTLLTWFGARSKCCSAKVVPDESGYDNMYCSKCGHQV